MSKSVVSDPKRLGQLIFGGIFLVAFIVYFLTARDMPQGALRLPGPGMFPTWVGAAGILISVIVIIEALLGKAETGAINFPRGKDLKVIGIFIVTLVGFMVVLPFLGQILSSALYAITFLWWGGKVKWWKAIVIGGAIGLGLSLFFMGVLGMQLPRMSL